MKIKLYQLDTFTNQLFKGNPAAVCLLESWLADDILQAIAAENNLSETAFIVPRHNDYHIRWFTPACEVDLCGHGTLAASYVVMNYLEPTRKYITFHSASGPLHVSKKAGSFAMDFPAGCYEQCEAPEHLIRALKIKPVNVYRSSKYLVIFESETQIRDLTPDFSMLKKLDLDSVIVTSKGTHVDFVSRFFAPKKGINEDPVTGSAHCLLAPFWAEQLGKHQLKAQQLSARGGEILCQVEGDRVILIGEVRPYLKGVIELN